MASAKVTKEIVKLSREANVVPFIWGYHGVGKSSVVRQVCKDIFGYVSKKDEKVNGKLRKKNFIDLRLGNLEVGDLTGLPIEAQMEKALKTIFAIPEYWPEDGEGIIFLDELNRAQSVVLQACFQLILDRAIHTYFVPDGWSIVAAGNPEGDDYRVNIIEPALFSRFLHVGFKPTKNEWVEFASESGNFLADIPAFISENDDVALFGKEAQKNINDHFDVSPDPRSYELLSRMLRAAEKQNVTNESVITNIVNGLIGKEIGANLMRYLAQSDRAIPGDKILDSYDAPLRKKVKKWNASANANTALIKATCDGVVRELKDRLNENKDYFKNLTRTVSKAEIKKESLKYFSKSPKDDDTFFYNEKLSNLTAFFTDVPSEFALASLRRDIHNDEYTNSENPAEVEAAIHRAVMYIFNVKEFAKEITAELGKVRDSAEEGKLDEDGGY